MSTYAIGDIQGCYTQLRTLLDKVAFDPARDTLWLVGDLVNRGPDSLEVLRFVKGLGERAVVVLGNHDLHLIMRAEGYGRGNKDDTLDAVLQAPDCAELLHWLRHRPLLHEEGDFAMVHAGLLPQWSVAQAADLAGEVACALRANDYREFLANMRGSQPATWSDDLQGWDRLRVIVNAMTRMRFCTPEGTMEFHAKGDPKEPPQGYLPWFAVSQRASLSHTVVFGHWSALGLHLDNNVFGLDTGCLWGGQLSAICLESRQVFQVEGVRSAAL